MFFGWNFWNDNGRIEGYLQNNLIFEYSWGTRQECVLQKVLMRRNFEITQKSFAIVNANRFERGIGKLLY